MYKSIRVEDVLGKSNFNKDYLDRTSLILSNRESPLGESVVYDSNEEDTGWKEINRKIATSLQTLNKPDIEKKTNNSDIKKIHIDNISDDLNELLNMFLSAGINVRVTSGYREGAVTAQGNKSHHSTGNAIDIVPLDGNFVELKRTIITHPEISAFMRSKGFGIIDETTPEMLTRTGGTGAHFHIGPDKLGLKVWKEIDVQSSQV